MTRFFQFLEIVIPLRQLLRYTKADLSRELISRLNCLSTTVAANLHWGNFNWNLTCSLVQKERLILWMWARTSQIVEFFSPLLLKRYSANLLCHMYYWNLQARHSFTQCRKRILDLWDEAHEISSPNVDQLLRARAVCARGKRMHRTLTLKLLTPGNLSASSTKQSSKKMLAFWTHRKEILFSILVVLNPLVPLRTMKALIWLVSKFLAHITTTSAKVAFPIQRFLPFRIHPPGTCTLTKNISLSAWWPSKFEILTSWG